MMGKPCVKGTRITVELILRKLGAGRSFSDILEAVTGERAGKRIEGSPSFGRGHPGCIVRFGHKY